MKKLFLVLGLFMATAQELFSYTYTFYNATTEPVWIDPYWDRLSFDNEQMFQGIAPQVNFDPTQLEWTNPHNVKGPVQLLPQRRYVFKFTSEWWFAGLCFSRIFLGRTREAVRKVSTKIVTSEQYDTIMTAANLFSQQTGGAAKDVGETAGQFGPKGKAVGVAIGSSGQAAEKLVSGITGLLQVSRCGNLDFLITTDVNKNLVALIEK